MTRLPRFVSLHSAVTLLVTIATAQDALAAAGLFLGQKFAAGDTPRSVAVGDLDGDTVPDAVTANSSSHDVSVLLGNGDGTFQAQLAFAAGSSPYSVAIEDLDGFYTFAIGTRDGFAVLRDPIACKHAVLAETGDWVAMATEYRAIATLPGAEAARIWEPAPAHVYSWSRN